MKERKAQRAAWCRPWKEVQTPMQELSENSARASFVGRVCLWDHPAEGRGLGYHQNSLWSGGRGCAKQLQSSQPGLILMLTFSRDPTGPPAVIMGGKEEVVWGQALL